VQHARNGRIGRVRLATTRRLRRSSAQLGSRSPGLPASSGSLVSQQDRSGVARLDRRTKNLTKRLKPGDIAIIDHVDIDRVSAEALVRCQVAAVVNTAASISGRYPNAGPEILLNAGIPLLDRVEQDVFVRVREGDAVTLSGGCLFRGGEPVAEGIRQSSTTIEAATAEARAGLAEQLEAFAENTMEFLRRERDLLLDGVGVPQLKTQLAGRHVLLVVRGYEYRQDLASLRPYIREYRPVLIGVDGGADALHEEGYRPDLIIGDMDSVSDEMLHSGAELVLHAYPDGSAPGLERLERLGLQARVFPAPGTSEDVAMLLADELGATLIVAVGTHGTLVEFLDKGRAGMASTFLTRLRVGGKLVDAKGVSRLYRSRTRHWSRALPRLSSLAALIVALSLSTVGHEYVPVLVDKWRSLTFWLS
jgi:uncharacterized membrane-anchored protein